MTDKPAVTWNRILAAGVAAALTVVLTAAAPAVRSARSPSWRVVKTFTLHNTFLDDIVAFGGGTARAGGESPAQTPALHHLTGRTWHTVSLPGSLGMFVPNMSATSAGNVWAALANEPLVAHLTSGGWVTTSFAQSTDDVATDRIVTIGPKNTWVFAYDFTTMTPFAEHFKNLSPNFGGDNGAVVIEFGR
jgi:hypothetical protein